ncbi:MAG: ComF family protein [Gammaproteobacteria bacterium]|nr:ComF family protein [Gammaproteobacteria bacterium]
MFVDPVDTRFGTSRLMAALFPPTCVLCGAPGIATAGGRDLCPGCMAELPYNRDACIQCAIPFESPMPLGVRCAACQRHAPPFDTSLAAFRYETAIPSLVVGVKFRGRLNLARLLGQCLADRVREADPPRPEVLLPVPLHPSRLRTRGYNQALEIARVVGRELALPIDDASCIRIAPTPPQAGLDERARHRNIRGAFLVQGLVPWRHVAILDDVVTTGSTVAELSRVLRRVGVQRIQVWAVARTP